MLAVFFQNMDQESYISHLLNKIANLEIACGRLEERDLKTSEENLSMHAAMQAEVLRVKSENVTLKRRIVDLNKSRLKLVGQRDKKQVAVEDFLESLQPPQDPAQSGIVPLRAKQKGR